METPEYPRVFTIGITDRCNAKCIMCFRTHPNEAIKERKDMPLEMLDKIHEALLKANVIRWYADGEFFVLKDFHKYMDYIKHYTARENGFSTNGMLLKKYAAEIAESNFSFIDISLDGATPDTLQGIRRGVKLATVVEGILALKSECEKINKPVPRLKFVFCSMRRNIEEIPLVVELAHQLGVSVVYMMPLDTGFHPELEQEKLSHYPNLERRYFLKAKELANRHDIIFDHTHREALGLGEEKPAEVEKTSADKEENANDAFTCQEECEEEDKIILLGRKVKESETKEVPCPLPWSDMLITQEGDVKVCCYNPRILGNFTDQSLEEIWHGDKYKKLRESVANGTFNQGCGDGKCPIAGKKMEYVT